MPMEFTPEQLKAVNWKFRTDPEIAAWIKEIETPKGTNNGKSVENYADATITSRFNSYKQQVWQDKALLEKIEAEYAAEKQSAITYATRDIAKNIDVLAYSETKNKALTWGFKERYADQLTEFQSKQTGGQAKISAQELYNGYEKNLISNASELFTIIDRYEDSPKAVVEEPELQNRVQNVSTARQQG